MIEYEIIGVRENDYNKRCRTRSEIGSLGIKFTKQLGDVLKHVDAMNEVDTSNVEPMAHAIDFVNVMREDKVYYEQTKEELMKNAPDEENGFFRVPKIN